ncbi:MAG: GNAT family N-acetyltransferase [Solirubrobacterales bacterium]|nr:GNAT family N-acetyltransferase [Solirubrobacterales bacterium]
MATRTPLSVRRARPEDFEPLAATLARAFYDDPVTAWFYPDDARRMRHARRFFAIRMRQIAGQDEIYTTPEHSGGALWTLPDRWREDLRQALMLLPMLPVLLPRIVRSARAVREIERRHPAEPHFYLSVLGTDPDQQGGGIASALLAPVLERCDSDGLPAYLESSRESNVGFYARHGFEVTERMELPDGPPLWLMWRDPRPAGRPAGR